MIDNFPIYIKNSNNVKKQLFADFKMIASKVSPLIIKKKPLPKESYVEEHGDRVFTPSNYTPKYESQTMTIDAAYFGDYHSVTSAVTGLSAYLSTGLFSMWFDYKNFGYEGIEFISIKPELIMSNTIAGDFYYIEIKVQIHTPVLITKDKVL